MAPFKWPALAVSVSEASSHLIRKTVSDNAKRELLEADPKRKRIALGDGHSNSHVEHLAAQGHTPTHLMQHVGSSSGHFEHLAGQVHALLTEQSLQTLAGPWLPPDSVRAAHAWNAMHAQALGYTGAAWNAVSTGQMVQPQVERRMPPVSVSATPAWNAMHAQTLGYTEAAWNAELTEQNVQTQAERRMPPDSVRAAPACNAMLAAAKLAEGSTVSETASANSAVAELSFEPVEGLDIITKGMSAGVKEAASAWCREMDIPSVELLVEAELEAEFIAAIGAQPGGIQERVLLKRLANVANADGIKMIPVMDDATRR